MSFRKRSTPLPPRPPHGTPTPTLQPTTPPQTTAQPRPALPPPPGTRPSTHPSRPALATTSTGTPTLDALLGLGAGQPLGTALAVAERGTTDFAAPLLRCCAAQGVAAGQAVFVAGAGAAWAAALPGVVAAGPAKPSDEKSTAGDKGGEVHVAAGENQRPAPAGDEADRMKIAWRYQRLRAAGESEDGALGQALYCREISILMLIGALRSGSDDSPPFCYTFDLTKRLAYTPSSIRPVFLPSTPACPLPSLDMVIQHLKKHPNIPARLILPSFLSPLYYPALPTSPQAVIRYLHRLRALLRKHQNLIVMLSWPLSLYPRGSTLAWWMELLVDGVITLEPLPHGFRVDNGVAPAKADGENQEAIQGFLHITKLPFLTERGIGASKVDDMAFAVGKRGFVIKPFSLPPLEGEQENVASASSDKRLEF
jgi:elongator complex protein 4